MRKIRMGLAFFIVIGLMPSLGFVQTKMELDVATIMQDPAVWIGSSPKAPYWSDDGKWIYFYWNPDSADADSLYKISPDGGQAFKVPLSERRRIPAADGEYSRDYRFKLFARDGDILLYDIKRHRLLQITSTAETEAHPQFSQDEQSVIYQKGANLYRWDRNTGAVTQLIDFQPGKKPELDPEPRTEAERFVKREELELIRTLRERREKRERQREARQAKRPLEPPKFYVGENEVESPTLSPDGRFITFRLVAKEKDVPKTLVPNYVTESGFTEELHGRPKVGAPEAGSKFAFVDLQEDTLIYVLPDSLPGINAIQPFTSTQSSDSLTESKAREVDFHGPYWSADGKRAFVVVLSRDNKDRWLATLNLPSGKLTSFEHQHDDAWIGGPNIVGWGHPGLVGWMPDNKRVWFCSEETGFSHLYACDPVRAEKTALTRGDFEIYHPEMSRDKKYWYFSANKVHPGERHVYRMPIEGGSMQKLTGLVGQNEAVWSPNGERMVIQHSYLNRPPELFIQKTAPGASARQLTHATKENWLRYPWREPEIIQFNARDGARPYARLYRPETPNGAAVLFVHGAGYLQNAHKGWSEYYREYMFHNLLADRGFTVLDIDYRGSAGYGRDWRTAIYRQMGGKDLDDQIDGAKWLADSLRIDPGRIGIYGGSYGGFITFMAMFTEPDVFAAGAALRPVTDWAHYNHPYTSNILNLPQSDSTAYRRSSPIYHAEGLKGRLLICHGMIDANVHFQDTVRLVQRLIELGKTNWEVAIYPLEGHGFKTPSSWTDEYRRILKLFTETLL